jgi:two-component system CheB/CheR fusion protein
MPIYMFTREIYAADATKKRAAVLIVEDERVSRRALTALLSASGYVTEAAGSGEEALRLVGAGPVPPVALVDLDLPGMSGIDFIGRIEQMDPSVFPVLITAADEDRLRVAVARLRALAPDHDVVYLRKPVSFDELLTVLDQKQLPH